MITEVKVKEVRPGEWEWCVDWNGLMTVGGNARSCGDALRFATDVVRCNTPRPAPWWRRIWRKEAKQ